MVDKWGSLVKKNRDCLKKQAAMPDLEGGRKRLMYQARDPASKLE